MYDQREWKSKMNRRDFLKKTSVVGIPLVATTALIASPKDVGATSQDSFHCVDYESLLRPNLLKDMGSTDRSVVKDTLSTIINICTASFLVQLSYMDKKNPLSYIDLKNPRWYSGSDSMSTSCLSKPGYLNHSLNLLCCDIRCKRMSIHATKKYIYLCSIDDIHSPPTQVGTSCVLGNKGLFCDLFGSRRTLLQFHSWYIVYS